MAKPTTSSSIRSTGFSSTRVKYIFTCVFFFCGFVKIVVHDNILAGAEDILENTNYSTGWISAMVNIPYIFTVVFMQVVHDRVKHIYQVWFGCLTIILGSAGVGFLPITLLKIAAVCFTGVGVAVVEIAMMALTVRYPDAVVHSFVTGDAFGRLLTPVMYTVLTSHLCVKPSVVFTTISLSTIIFPLQDHLMSNRCSDVHKSIQYQMIQDKQTLHDEETVNRESLSEEEEFDDSEDDKDEQKVQERKHSSLVVTLWLFYKSFSRYYAAYLGFALQTLYAQSFITTLVFPNSPFKPREHYQYYLMALWSGAFIGRALGFVCECCGKIANVLSANTMSSIHIAFSVFNLSALFVAVWYRSMPNVWVVLLLCFVSGVIAGMGYLISLSPVSEKDEHVVFTRIMAVNVKGVACVIAALIAIPLEPLIRQRCFEITHTAQYCIARYIGIGEKPCYNT